MNRNQFFLAYQQARPGKKTASNTAYCRRQCQARRRIEVLRDLKSFGLTVSDLNLLEK